MQSREKTVLLQRLLLKRSELPWKTFQKNNFVCVLRRHREKDAELTNRTEGHPKAYES